jgi:dCMP deaminase
MNLDWRLKWDLFFMGMAKYMSTASKDPSTKVGAVIVDRDNIVQGMGYNGFPRGVEDSDERYADREWKYPLVVHAEANAIINAGKRAKGARIYVWPTLMMPAACPECAKLIVQSGLKQVIYFYKDNVEERWEKNAKFTSVLLTEGGVQTRAIRDYSDGGPVF